MTRACETSLIVLLFVCLAVTPRSTSEAILKSSVKKYPFHILENRIRNAIVDSDTITATGLLRNLSATVRQLHTYTFFKHVVTDVHIDSTEWTECDIHNHGDMSQIEAAQFDPRVPRMHPDPCAVSGRRCHASP